MFQTSRGWSWLAGFTGALLGALLGVLASDGAPPPAPAPAPAGASASWACGPHVQQDVLALRARVGLRVLAAAVLRSRDRLAGAYLPGDSRRSLRRRRGHVGHVRQVGGRGRARRRPRRAARGAGRQASLPSARRAARRGARMVVAPTRAAPAPRPSARSCRPAGPPLPSWRRRSNAPDSGWTHLPVRGSHGSAARVRRLGDDRSPLRRPSGMPRVIREPPRGRRVVPPVDRKRPRPAARVARAARDPGGGHAAARRSPPRRPSAGAGGRGPTRSAPAGRR